MNIRMSYGYQKVVRVSDDTVRCFEVVRPRQCGINDEPADYSVIHPNDQNWTYNI